MGWTVLYIAFGVVALWLLGEVLLQYKARLRYRLLAFGGFLGVVLGVLLPSVLVIALGAIAFAVGQTYVTLSFRRGFSTGWALGGSPGASRRRRSGSPQGAGATREPTLEVSDLAYEPGTAQSPEPRESRESPENDDVYEPQPLPEETGQYGIYNDTAYAAATEQDQSQNYAAYDTGYDTYSGYGQQPAGQDSYAGQYDYGTGQQQYAAYSDPYVGGQQHSAYSYDAYDSYGGQQQYADPYAQQQYSETPPGGVWVPQQRDGEQQVPPAPQEEPSPYGYDSGYNEQQYRY
ncbi:hypothetical protein OG883_21880 [Streptomyces sp. NBC_01142]|uniref:hypothetical protein n=1 Tax=Streptomyces sp. NBC_01142 TaxID=2975865 RepID=UPI00224DD805|nr:hypothetical protein [Streptomyces sp. NBC_01142]MCX4822494.1 hypothetical protein [Streptomyces sp. NBC_01142]